MEEREREMKEMLGTLERQKSTNKILRTWVVDFKNGKDRKRESATTIHNVPKESNVQDETTEPQSQAQRTKDADPARKRKP